MTQEALKLALKVLEDCVNSYGMKYDRPTFVKTITAIKEALAKEKTLQALHSENERLGLYKDAYAQPEQEPVAYYHPHKGFYFAKPTSVSAPTIVDVESLALYTTPLQRTWVGLTDEEIDSCFEDHGWSPSEDYYPVIKAIEAKLKERNT